MPAWLTFLISAAVVVIAGARLARDGDAIADRTKLGSAWVGAILVAGATSLPEIATDVAAVRQGEPELAVGDLFGSSMANMMILAIADLFTRRTRLLHTVTIGQALVGTLAVSLTALAAIGVLSRQESTVAGLGWAPLAIGAGYILGTRLLHVNRAVPEAAGSDDGGTGRNGPSLRTAVIGFAIAATVILIAGPYLASSAAMLAMQWGVASGFFGMVFLAAATSLPEASVVIAAIRNRTYELAVGNLLGSNCSNMFILLVLDAVDGGGSLLAETEPGMVMGALFAMLLTGQAVLDVLGGESERRGWYLEPGPALMIATYAGGLFLTYRAMS